MKNSKNAAKRKSPSVRVQVYTRIKKSSRVIIKSLARQNHRSLKGELANILDGHADSNSLPA